ncbi:MAG TPA: hypothetical protein VGJ28_25115 [Micromonosporaceae bacterium]|jgi:hypothetical protein
MKKPPAIFGIGWTDAPASALTLSYVGTSDEDAAVALAAVAGHALSTDGSYALPHDRLTGLPDGDVADLLADMVEDELDVVVVFSTGRGAAEDPYVQLLRDMHDSGRAEVVYGEAHWWPSDDVATDPYPLIERWAKMWPDSLPIAHELKELFEDQWVRFHSLPSSKRTPETSDDWATVLSRHNTVLADLALPTDDLLVIMSVVASSPMPADDEDFWTSVGWHYADPDLLFAHLYVTTEEWQPGALDDLLRLAVEQQIGGVIIAPLDLGWLYHPYAGGADVITPHRDALATRFATWRSSHPSGL